MTSLTRRIALKLFAAGSALVSGRRSHAAVLQEDRSKPTFHGFAGNTNDRVWLGEDFWANPMEDWRIVDGAAECQSRGGDRNVHLLTHQLTNADGTFWMSVQVEGVEVGQADGGVGFRVGIRSDLNEFRSNSFAKSGVNAGMMAGRLLLGRREIDLNDGDPASTLLLEGKPQGENYQLTISSLNKDGKPTTSLSAEFPKAMLPGNVALVNNFAPRLKKNEGSRYRFRDWKVGGDAFTVTPQHKFGPILWSMYTLSDSRSSEGFVMKISALVPPLGPDDDHSVELQVKRQDAWKSLGHQWLHPEAWVATFRIANWDETKPHDYRLVYREKKKDRSVVESDWTGTIKPNPSGRPLRLAALTCQNDYGFPYEPVAQNLIRLDPDMLYFSGDQLYENHGGYGIIRDPAEPAILNYLRKFYQFGWAFREALKNAPTVCIPDDHDVFQGNIWGEGGKAMEGIDQGASSKGGYREPARMVNVVHKTCAGHHPDYFDPTPCLQDISVYYGDMVYGNVSFAILGDRQFKSGPEHVETGSGRADHVTDPDIDMSKLDAPGLELLGKRQEDFLKHWVKDWRGHEMKVLLSQTVFAGVATHHGGYNGYLRADLDCGSWPQTPRNRAVRILKEGMPLHVNGDQHLTTLVQYGTDNQRDSCWSFCTPAISAGYPRWWRPDEVDELTHQNRPQHNLPNTGEYVDSFGNKAYVYAVGNPEVGSIKDDRYALAHQKGSGFGMITIDCSARTYLVESFRFQIDATDGNPNNQFPGWPVLLHQKENKGENVLS